jgi:regulator of sirC expression with transglutaminase-like and TPR domain
VGGADPTSSYHRDVSGLDAAPDANRARFARLIARPEPEINLALGALLIAAQGRGRLDPEPWLRVLDDLATRVRIHLDRGDDRARTLDTLHDVLYRDLAFRAPDLQGGASPDLSRLDRVLQRRVGLPISLAIVELEVGWRLGLPLHGVGLPGHFVVGGPGDLLLDPADGGRRLTRDDCQALVRRAVGDGVLLHAGMLRAVGRREILARVLRNLRAAHLSGRDWPAALGAIELLRVVEPTSAEHGRDRGLLLGRMGRFSEGLAELARYLEERPEARDGDDVRQVIGIFGGRRN